jgi:type VI protein secretion system component Hcp
MPSSRDPFHAGSGGIWNLLCAAKCYTSTDKASPVLEQKCAQGVVFPSAQLELITTDANRLRFYQITLSNVVVSSVSTSGGPDKPEESVCLNFFRLQETP